MAHIEKRTVTSGRRWEVRWRDGDGKDRSRSFRRSDQANQFKTEVEAERHGGPVAVDVQKTTVRAWSKQWMDGEAGRLAPQTLSSYRSLLKVWILPPLGDYPLGRLTPSHLRDWMEAILAAGCSPARAAHARRALRRMLQVAVNAELIPRNPCTVAVVAPKVPERSVEPLTPKQLVQLADTMGTKWSALVLATGTGGGRLAEMGALRRCDVSADGRSVTITATMHQGHVRRAPKTKAGRRTVSLPPIAATALLAHLDAYVEQRPEALLWPSLVTGTAFRRHWHRARCSIGRSDLHFHDLRHCAASFAVGGGADAKVLQGMLGHATLTMTLERYGHLLPSSSSRVADAVQSMFEP